MMEKQLDVGALKGKKGFSKRGVSKPREVKCGVFWRPYKSFLNSNQSAGKQRSGDGFNGLEMASMWDQEKWCQSGIALAHVCMTTPD